MSKPISKEWSTKFRAEMQLRESKEAFIKTTKEIRAKQAAVRKHKELHGA